MLARTKAGFVAMNEALARHATETVRRHIGDAPLGK
jgi:hypothetical protein